MCCWHIVVFSHKNWRIHCDWLKLTSVSLQYKHIKLRRRKGNKKILEAPVCSDPLQNLMDSSSGQVPRPSRRKTKICSVVFLWSCWLANRRWWSRALFGEKVIKKSVIFHKPCFFRSWSAKPAKRKPHLGAQTSEEEGKSIVFFNYSIEA